MKLFKKKYLSLSLLVAVVAAVFVSCNAVYEDLQPCEKGLKVRFVYDYNMEFANAFHSQVDVLTVNIYDENGEFIDQRVAYHDKISDESWRMDMSLEPGKYTILAFGGMDSERPSFTFGSRAEATPMEGVTFNVLPSMLTAPEGNALHHLYYGRKEVVVEKDAEGITEATVYMMKDTNDFRILLAYEDGRPVNVKEFEFTITDDNTHLNWRNNVIAQGGVNYYPWTRGESSAGTTPDGETAMAAYAEISTSRLFTSNNSRLEVKRVKDGRKVVSIPLNEVLLMLKSDRYGWMDDQEFLDRQSVWNISFVLTGDAYWTQTSIVINNWIVRLNNIEG